MPTLHAEIQVDGYSEPLDTFTLTVEQAVDYAGRPSRVIRIRPIRITLTGLTAVLQFFQIWAADHCMRRSGHIIVYEDGKTRYRLTFYDAWCILHRTDFQPNDGDASFQVTIDLSPASIEVNGIPSEIHTDLWWEKNAITRFNALTKPPEILPSPSLRAILPQVPLPLDPSAIPKLSPITGAPQMVKPPVAALDPTKKPPYAPTIDKWYRKGGSIELLDNGNWKFIDWEKNTVIYEGDEPNYDYYARQKVDIVDMQGNYTTDFDKANENAALGHLLKNNTWHHMQNMVTMQEVPTEIHRRFTHYGGCANIKKAKAALAVNKVKIRRKKP